MGAWRTVYVVVHGVIIFILILIAVFECFCFLHGDLLFLISCSMRISILFTTIKKLGLRRSKLLRST